MFVTNITKLKIFMNVWFRWILRLFISAAFPDGNFWGSFEAELNGQKTKAWGHQFCSLREKEMFNFLVGRMRMMMMMRVLMMVMVMILSLLLWFIVDIWYIRHLCNETQWQCKLCRQPHQVFFRKQSSKVLGWEVTCETFLQENSKPWPSATNTNSKLAY